MSEDRKEIGQILQQHGLHAPDEGDEKLLTWHPKTDSHPRKYSNTRKWVNVIYILAAEAQTAAMSSAGTAAADAAMTELGISRTLAYFIFTTIAILAEALSSLVTPAISESFGRRPQYVFGAGFSCVGNGIAAVPHPVAIAIGRFISGFAGAIPPGISPGAIEDIIEDTRTRTRALFAWSTASVIGLAGGPIISSILVAKLGWQATFYAGLVSSFTLTCFALCFTESRPSTVLIKKLDSVRRSSVDDAFHIDHPDQVHSWRDFVRDTLTRPTRLLFTEPIVFIIAILTAIAYSLIYGFTGAITIVYSEFGFSAVESNLAFIPVLIGSFLPVFCRVWDEKKLDRMHRTGMPVTPEDKLDSFSVSVPFLAAGLWIFSWTIPLQVVHVHWAVSMIGLITVGCAANDFTTVLSGYLVESYGPYASSAFAAVGWCRSLSSAALTLVISPMFENLGNNVAGTVFAAIATLFCVSPWILKRHGKTLRSKSAFAQWSARVAEETALAPLSGVPSDANSSGSLNTLVDGAMKHQKEPAMVV